jgi:hypothetical protein
MKMFCPVAGNIHWPNLALGFVQVAFFFLISYVFCDDWKFAVKTWNLGHLALHSVFLVFIFLLLG